jgi:phosphoribosyl-ATP pyrophosphohydrolase/phosphoribosyl-AMP cyclohydrolase
MSFKNIEIEKIDFSKSDGLVPAIVQDAKTSRVLMLGYMNEESLEKTISSQKVCFFSRSKQRLWVKGESSGNFLNVVEIGQDCDDDTLLILADPVGPTCHKGTDSCFGDLAADLTTFGDLDKLIEKRSQEKDSNSYSYSLLKNPLKAAQQLLKEKKS